jgi:AraC-like DNA-binding protein
MNEHVLYIKNMVCDRCVRVVREELERLGYRVTKVTLGEVQVRARKIDGARVAEVLRANGFELIDDRRMRTVERIKAAILRRVRTTDGEDRENFSEYLAREVGAEYHYLSGLFSDVENVTIEKYIILQRIERVKELLKYGELTLSEIAYQLNYSSVAHLSGQFKQVTGLTPSEFKRRKVPRKPLDRVTRR